MQRPRQSTNPPAFPSSNHSMLAKPCAAEAFLPRLFSLISGCQTPNQHFQEVTLPHSLVIEGSKSRGFRPPTVYGSRTFQPQNPSHHQQQHHELYPNSQGEMALCQNRLQEERKQWRRDHPFGFFAKPQRNAQGVLDLKVWECGIPGKDKTLWEGGLFKMSVIFPDGKLSIPSPSRFESSLTQPAEYPTKPPKCTKPFRFHKARRKPTDHF